MLRAALLAVAVVCASAQWLPDGNYYDMRIQSCSGQPSLHGLWPQWQGGENCQAAAYDASKMSSILSLMEQYWASCDGPLTNNQFWDHEWTKHGSCSGMDQLTYFTTVLNLFQNYGLNTQPPANLCFSRNSLSLMSCPSDGDADSYNSATTTDVASSTPQQKLIGAIVGAGCAVVFLAAVAVIVVIQRRRAAAYRPDLPLFATVEQPL